MANSDEKGRHTLGFVISVMLLYYSVDLFKSYFLGTASSAAVVLGAAMVFGVAGIGMLFVTGRYLWKHRKETFGDCTDSNEHDDQHE